MMPGKPVTIVGSYLCPYVRKVLVCLQLKNIEYTIDPGIPWFGNDEISRFSPARPLPWFTDDQVTLSDSTVICEYLDDSYPTPTLYPATPQSRARARWLEEYADTRMGAVFVWQLFHERVLKPLLWGQASDEQLVERTTRCDVPQVLDYLEHEYATTPPHRAAGVSVSDIAIASFMRSAAHAGFELEAARWPALSAVVNSAWSLPAFTALEAFEALSLQTPLAEQRRALQAAGAPVLLGPDGATFAVSRA
jgi:glutathione S-transferase